MSDGRTIHDHLAGPDDEPTYCIQCDPRNQNHNDGPTIDHDERVARLRDAYMDASVRMMGAANKFRQLSEMAHGAQQEAMEAATAQEGAFHEWHHATQQRAEAEADRAQLERITGGKRSNVQTPTVTRPAIHSLHYYLDGVEGHCVRCDMEEDSPVHMRPIPEETS